MTRRSNEERLGMPTTGAKHSDEAPPVFDAPENSTENNNSLSYVVPTEIVELPSQGKFYPEGHPLHQVNEIEIKEMTAKEEDILTTESFIRKGILFDRLLASLIVDKSIKTEDLLVGDRNALLVAARISGYGAAYPTEVACPVCDEIYENHEFDLALCSCKELVDVETTEDEDLSGYVAQSLDGNFLITLPKSRVTLEVKLLTGRDELGIAHSQEMKRKKKLPESPLTEHMKRVTVSINGVVDSIQVDRFIKSMPASDSQFFRKTIRKLTPNLDMTQEFVCDNCGHEQDLEVPITPRFFWPDS